MLMRYGTETHLTVNRRRNVHTKKAEYRTHKASHSRDGVNLSSEHISPGETGNQGEATMATDPYRPPVRDTAPKDLPFVVKRSEELPPAHGWL